MWVTVNYKELNKALQTVGFIKETWYIKLETTYSEEKSDQLSLIELKKPKLKISVFDNTDYISTLIDCEIIEEGEVKASASLIDLVKQIKDDSLMLRASSVNLEVSGLTKHLSLKLDIYGFEYKNFNLSLLEEGESFSFDFNSIAKLTSISTQLFFLDTFVYTIDSPLIVRQKTGLKHCFSLSSDKIKFLSKFKSKAEILKSDSHLKIETNNITCQFVLDKFSVDVFRRLHSLFNNELPTYSLKNIQLNDFVSGIQSIVSLSQTVDKFLFELKDNNFSFTVLDKTRANYKLNYSTYQPDFKLIINSKKFKSVLGLLTKATTLDIKAATNSSLLMRSQDLDIFMDTIDPDLVRY